MRNSRTANVIRNISWAIPLQIITMLLQFAVRTVFVHTLGARYLGINGLFTNIFTMLSFAELGIGNAIVFSMYKPLAEQDMPRLGALMQLYRKAYRLIGLAVLVLGLALIPLLPWIIKDPPQISESMVVIYLLYLVQSVVSYFFAYKRTIISADQKDYIVNLYVKVFHFIQIIVQILIVLTTGDFLSFLMVQIVCTILMNIASSRKADRMYPFIREKTRYRLGKQEFSTIANNVKALFLYRIGGVVNSSMDSVLVSAIVGMQALGLCSNYTLVIQSIRSFLNQLAATFTASIGNLNVASDNASSEKVMKEVYFITVWLFGFLSVGLWTCLNALISVWLGKEYLLSPMVVFTLVLQCYLQGVQYAPHTFRVTMGLLGEKKYIPVVTAAINLVLSVVLGRWFGLVGIFAATSVALVIGTTVPEITLIYRKKFNASPSRFYLRSFFCFVVVILNGLITNLVLRQFSFTGWVGFFLSVILCTIVSNLLFVICFIRDKNFSRVVTRLRKLVEKRL